MPSIPRAILERAQSLKEGGVIAPKEFLHLGSRAAVDQAFCRLAKDGQLMRVARGTYVVPLRLNGQIKAPAIGSVANAIGAQGKHSIANTGERAAKVLGLIRKASTQDAYLTTGRSKQLQVGEQKAVLQHAPYWMFSLGARPAGDAVRALAWLGPDRASKAAELLHERLSEREWDALTSVRASLPSWMASAISLASTRSSMR